MLPTCFRRAVHVLSAVATCSVVLLVSAPAASADLGCDDVKGRPSTPGVHLPCNSPAPTMNPGQTERLGRKL